MLKKHLVLSGITIAIVLLLIATKLYPGGSLFDKNSIGFDWTKNFMSNLFGAKAMNGSDNPARFWADAGMIFLSVAYAIFFIQFSKKIPSTSSSKIIKYLGAGAAFFSFFVVTPLHDLVITISSTLYLISLFYITVYIFMSRLHVFKLMCAMCLLIFYYTLFLYGSGNYELLAIMQKVSFASKILLILSLHYYVEKEHFAHIQVKKANS